MEQQECYYTILLSYNWGIFMIKVTNNSTIIQHAIDVLGVTYDLPINGGYHYFDDTLISEVEAVTENNSDLKLINFAGPIIQRDELGIVGHGHGAAKTTTGVYGITITEDFGIGDELFIHWAYHPLIIRTIEPVIHFGFAPLTSEVDKLVSAEVSMLGGNGGSLINRAPTTVQNFTDLPIPAIAFTSADASMTIPVSEIADGFEDMSFKLKRIAATSNDLGGDVALHHAFVEYQRYLV